jgi:FAD/FMN-containing dehydrogenase
MWVNPMPHRQKLMPKRNAAGNARFTRGAALAEPARIARPVSVEDIQSEVLRCAEDGERLRVAGGGTAANGLWSTDENLLTLDHFTGVESSDLERGRIWVRAGTKLGALAETLANNGLALPMDGWSAGATIGGAVSVGAHGSGPKLSNLSAHVTAVGLITADGVLRRVSATEYADVFGAARLSLGALGVVSHVELECNVAHAMRMRCFKSALEDTLARLPELRESASQLSFEWFPGTGVTRVRTGTLMDAASRGEATHARVREWAMRNVGHWLLAHTSERLPRLARPAQRLAAQLLPESDRIAPGTEPAQQPWVRQTELMEYQLAVQDLPDALAQLERLLEVLNLRSYLAMEVGFVAADDVWLSPSYGRDSAFVRLRRFRGVEHPIVADTFSDVMQRHDARPHWGSPHGLDAQSIGQLYPRWNEFLHLRRELDPRGVFLNGYLSRLLGISQ